MLEVPLRPFAVHNNDSDSSRMALQEQSLSHPLKRHFGWQENTTGDTNSIRIPRFVGLTQLLHRGYAGAAVAADLPEWGMKYSTLLLSFFTSENPKSLEWPQTVCSEISWSSWDEGMQVHIWRGKTLHERPPGWALALKRYKVCEQEISHQRNSGTEKA